MKTSNNIGLQATALKPVVEGLQSLLASYQLFYTNLRGLHWHIAGDKFFELHVLYEEYYNEMAEKIDAVAERLIMIGAKPENRFSEYLKTSDVKEVSGISDWKKGTTNVIETLTLLVAKLRTIQSAAFAADDIGTAHLTMHDIKGFEKKLWMLTAYQKE